ncbi:MAG: Slp family lipoprotein [Nitrospira defluvii]|nr:Slp family lipoprotein [Nitrospira defluvii]
MRFHINRTLAGVIGLAVLMGCSSLPSRYVQQAEPGVTLTSLTESPEAYQGKTVILGGVVVDQKQDDQRLWLHLKNRPLDKDYRPHRPTVNAGLEAGLYWVVVSNASALPPKWKHWTRVTVVGRVANQKEVASSIAPTTEPVLTLLFMRGWTMGQAQQGGAWEESVDANYLLSVPEGLHGE